MLEKLQPQNVFHFFEEMTKIPHGSGNEKEISDYLVSFAKERGLEVIQDDILNVIIKAPGTKGYENAPTVIIQGHMDMVCEKTKSSTHDFLKDPLKLRIDGDYVYATDTTLGSDDGIAVAYGLAVIDSKDIAHGPIELVVTISEETGMDGAAALDTSVLNGKILLNIDSEEEGIFLVSCAGGVNTIANIKTEWEPSKGSALKLEVSGLNGGHSGMEIIKQRANANKLMGRLLYTLSKEVEFNMVSVNGGTKHNAISRDCEAIITVSENDVNRAEDICKKAEEIFKAEYRVEDPNISITAEKVKSSERQLTKCATKNVVNFMVSVPDGVQTMSKDIEGLVESSLNYGVLVTTDEEVKSTLAVRSSVKSIREAIVDKIEAIVKVNGGAIVNENEYPAWEYEENSKIRDLCVSTYEKLFNKEPQINAIHAGLECGLLKEKMKDTEMISFGPDLMDVHTANEHMSISSVARMWDFLVELLKEIK